MELLELARTLVGFNTVSDDSSTDDIANFIANYCESEGFIVNPFAYRNKKYNKINLVATKGGNETFLALSGHMDTVKCQTDPTKSDCWKTNPHELIEFDGRFYGLGIADMKIFLAIAMKAGAAIPEKDLKRPFALYFTSDEEIGCIGAKKLVKDERFRPSKYIVIGEPTEGYPSNLHKGYMNLQIVMTAFFPKDPKDFLRPYHSSKEAVSSVVEFLMPSVVNCLHQFRLRLRSMTDTRFNPDHPTMNIGGEIKMLENANKNTIPREVTMICEVRPVPGQDTEDLFHLLDQTLKSEVKKIQSPIEGEEFQTTVKWVTIGTPPMDTSLDSILLKEINLITRHSPITLAFNTEGGVFNWSGAETIIWGPASSTSIHHANEYVESSIFRDEVVDQYIALIRRMCC